MSKRLKINGNALSVPISIMIGFAMGALLLMAIGISPLAAYGKLSEGVFGKLKYLVWSIVYASPLIFTGLSVAFSFKTGVFNIGAEGQFIIGSLTACFTGVTLDLPAPLHVLVCIVVAIMSGAIWGAIVGLLKIKRGVNEVLSYIMFNWIAFYLSNYVVNLPRIRRTGGGEASKDVLNSARILFPESIRKFFDCSAINWGIIFAIIAAIVIWFVINRTAFGYQLRAVGTNKSAAQYAGINTNKMFLISMSISGALAGLGGAVQTLGMSGRISQFAGQEGFGFQGITVALIASSSPIGCIFSGLFYGAMKYGGSKLSLVETPSEVVDIIMGTIIFCIAISHIFRHLIKNKKVISLEKLNKANEETQAQNANIENQANETIETNKNRGLKNG